MMKKLIAITLCLALTMLTCACAASNATVSTPEQSENKGGNTPDLSTMEQLGTSLPVAQMSSQPAFSDAVSTPTEPTLPEEKETTLEKVLSFDIGMDGLFEYWFQFDLDASEADIYLPGAPFADANGNFYQIDNFEIVQLNNGARLPFSVRKQVLDAVVSGDVLYVLYADDFVRSFDLSEGLAQASLLKEYPLETHLGTLFHSADGQPYFCTQNKFFTLEMQPVEQDSFPYCFVQTEKIGSLAVTKDSNGCYTISKPEEEDHSVESVTENGIVLMQSKSKKQTGTTAQKIYTAYSPNGETVSRYLYQEGSVDEKLSCEIQFVFSGENKTITKYRAHPVSIDNFWFETALDSMMMFDQDGIAYLIVYFPNRGEIYRIDPGYSDVQFTTKETVDK